MAKHTATRRKHEDRVLVTASEVFGSNQEAREWMNAETTPLGGKRPLDLLGTDLGEQEVLNLLNCIKWGVYS